MARSQNGWSTDPPRTSRTIPGAGVRVTVRDGDAGDVLMHVLARVDREVEDIDWRSTRGELDDWGYAERPVRGGSDTSNHASGTAVDVNATRHPLGVVGTFSARQVARIHEILAEVGDVVRWGGDYQGRKDEMHFEINADEKAVARVAARLREQHAAQPPEEDDDVKTTMLVHGDNRDPIYPGSKYAWGDLVFLVAIGPEHPGGAARRYIGGGLVFNRLVKVLGAPEKWDQDELDAISIVNGGGVPSQLLNKS
jgi:hypothetical protein